MNDTKEQPYILTVEEGKIKIHKMEKGVEIPLNSFAPEFILVNDMNVDISGRELRLKTIAKPGMLIHFFKGEIVWNHLAPFDGDGRINPSISVTRVNDNDEDDEDNDNEPEDGIESHYTYDDTGDAVDTMDLIVDAVVAIEIKNGNFQEAFIFDEEGRTITFNNVFDNGKICTGTMPFTDNPKRLMATIMANQGNADLAKNWASHFNKHHKEKDKWVLNDTPKGDRVASTAAQIWVKLNK